MKKYRVLYNPLSGGGRGLQACEELKKYLPDDEFSFYDLTKVEDFASLFANLSEDETLIIAGGDGTLSRFATDTRNVELPDSVEFFACGTGNDFIIDIGMKYPAAPFPVKKYLMDLPEVEVKGKRSLFINGIGYGIDGYVAEEASRQRDAGKKRFNYTAIALKGLLWAHRPAHARVTVDGVTKEYEKVWLAPTMQGRFFGGGMMIAPVQDRMNAERSVSVLVAHDLGKLRTLTIFPEIFNGTHVRHTDVVDIFTAHEVTVAFDSPCALQIDGECVSGVEEYTVRSAKARKNAEDKVLEAV